MFTGLIEKTALVKGLKRKKGNYYFCLSVGPMAGEVSIGDSIAVNGVCLTVVKNDKDEICFEVMPKTFKDTNISLLRKGDLVNIERALRIGERLGGHFVQGHVDTTVVIKDIKKKIDGLEFSLGLNSKIASFIVPKASVALDGISLTIGDVSKDTFSVYIIPHTFNETNLKKRKKADKLNLEIDILAKYSKNIPEVSGISEDFLKKHGF